MKKILFITCLLQCGLGLLSFWFTGLDVLYKVISIGSFILVAVGASMETQENDTVDKLTEQLIDSEKELLKSQQDGKSKKHFVADR